MGLSVKDAGSRVCSVLELDVCFEWVEGFLFGGYLFRFP